MTYKNSVRSSSRWCASIFLFLFLVSMACAQNTIEQVQAIPGELPDPSIIKVGTTYYATGTTGDWAPHYPIYCSPDLQDWKLIGYVLNKTPDWALSSFWAPELFYKNGTFFCYYTARGTDGISKVGVATTKDISKGFDDKGPLIEWGNEAIDAFVYEQNETLYITWKAYGLTPDKPIQLLGSKLSDDGLSLVGSEFEVLTANETDWEKGGMEGQCIVAHNGYLYMLYSGNNCCGADCDYMVGVARAKKMEGPWEKYGSNPLLVGNSSWKCPGHGTLVDTGAGWYYLYHAYNTDGFPVLGRAAVLSEMYWDDATGWPYFKVDAQTSDAKRITQNITDTFDKGHLENWWRINVLAGAPEVALTNGQLRMGDAAPNSDNKAGAVLCIVPDSPDFTCETYLKEKNNALKGLVLYTNENNSMGLGVKGNELVLWKVLEGTYTELNKVTLTKADDIQLRAVVNDAKNISFQYSTGTDAWKVIEADGPSSKNASGENLAWWSSGMKAGLQVRKDSGSGDHKGVFESFQVRY